MNTDKRQLAAADTFDVSPAAVVLARQKKREDDVEQEIARCILAFKAQLLMDPPDPLHWTGWICKTSGTRGLTCFVPRAALRDTRESTMWNSECSDDGADLFEYLCRRVTDHFREHGWDAFAFAGRAVDSVGHSASNFGPDKYTHRCVNLVLRLPPSPYVTQRLENAPVLDDATPKTLGQKSGQ